MKTFAIYTLGCKTNQLESAKITDDMLRYGWRQVNFKDSADIYIINSCTVTSKSDNEAVYITRKAKRVNPNAKVIMTGCYAQVSNDELTALTEIDLIAGNIEKFSLAEMISSGKYMFNSENKPENKIFVSNIMQAKEFVFGEVDSLPGKTRANIKIQDGCNNRCAYCIIPFARGKSRSNSLNNIIGQIQKLTQNGYKEVILTGIHLGQWGLDFSPKMNLPQLLSEFEKIPSLVRYRLSSLDPNEINSDLIKQVGDSSKFCPHFHISIQSMDNEILRSMRRRYSVEDVFKTVNAIKAAFPDAFIGCDIITGFPGESDSHFDSIYNNLKNLPLSAIHVFPYSRRKGTLAYDMPEQIPEHTKKERSRALNLLGKEKLAEFKQSQLNKVFNVIFEKSRDKQTGLLKGLTENYIQVLLDGDDSLMGEMVKVRLDMIDGTSVRGVILLMN